MSVFGCHCQASQIGRNRSISSRPVTTRMLSPVRRPAGDYGTEDEIDNCVTDANQTDFFRVE